MSTLKKLTLMNMRSLHRILSEHGVLCVSEVAEIGKIHKGTCQGWMTRLIKMGCITQAPKPKRCTDKRNNARYYEVTGAPFPDSDLAPDSCISDGKHEFRRIMRKAVNVGMQRDELLTAFYGEAKA